MSKILVPDVGKVYLKIKEILEKPENIGEINDAIKEYDSNATFHGVVVGSYKVIGLYPCCAIIPGAILIVPVGSAYTYEFRYEFDIGIYTKNIMTHESYFYHWKVSQVIWQILASPEYEKWIMDDGVVYLFDIFRGIDQGYTEGGAIRVTMLHAAAQCRKTLLVAG